MSPRLPISMSPRLGASSYLALLAVLLLANLAAMGTEPRHPFPAHVAYAPGTICPNHRTQTQLDDDVRAFYDRWKSHYLAQAGSDAQGNPRYRILLSGDSSDKTVSEGQGYGMAIVALMAGHDLQAQAIFDGLWKFALDHPSAIDSRLMDWSVPANEERSSEGGNSAFDGDCDMAFALLLAEKQWGNDGRWNYRAEAQRTLEGIMQSTIGPQSHLPMLGDWVKPDDKKYNQYTPRPSDFMPDHFRAFAAASSESVSAWNDVIRAVQDTVTYTQAKYSSKTGLMPDFMVPVSAANHHLKPARKKFLEGLNDGYYSYNAVRVPWRLGVDALLTGDPVSLAQARKISLWAAKAAKGKPSNLRSGYHLKGTVVKNGAYYSSIFAATFAVAAMTEPSQQAWLNSLYDAVCSSGEGYFEDTVTLQCLLVLTGNNWSP